MLVLENVTWGLKVDYRKRRYRRRSGGGFGSMIGDTAIIASRFGPKGALTTGVVGFVFFYFVVPWALAAWADHNKAKMVGQNAAVFSKVLDEIFLRRFIHPSEWAGIAILIAGIAIASWKAFTHFDVSERGANDVGWFAKIIARFLD